MFSKCKKKKKILHSNIFIQEKNLEACIRKINSNNFREVQGFVSAVLWICTIPQSLMCLEGDWTIKVMLSLVDWSANRVIADVLF